MKNYKITCPSIFIASLAYNYINNINDFHNAIIHNNLVVFGKVITFSSDRYSLKDLYEIFEGTPFNINIQEFDEDNKLVAQKQTP